MLYYFSTIGVSMTNEFIHFEKISRKTWQNLHRKTTPPLTQKELNSIKSFNDKISLQDVTDVYLPLTNLIQIYKRSKEDLTFSKGIFLQKASKRQPFIIGVSGSVAVGKSTTSRLLQILLSRTFSNATVELVTTDGFLYPNAHLEEQNLLKRKGFPESYNMELLLADNGVGIEKEDLKHIFERLYKCDKGRSEKGSGLGLSIVHQLVEKMGGSITVESLPGKGTEFMLLFPLEI